MKDSKEAALRLLGLLAFLLLATANSGGYQFGVSDQAFYIPAVLQRSQPDLFPRDTPLLMAQGRLVVVDDLLSALTAIPGLSLPTLMLALYLVSLALLFLGAERFGRALFRSPWTTTAFVLALTLRHRITKTGVNTLEGYFHPRILAFAIGVIALSAWLRGRPRLALTLAVAAIPVHPTTGAFFVIWVAVAAMVERGQFTKSPKRSPNPQIPKYQLPKSPNPQIPKSLLALVGLAGLAAIGASRLTVMDAAWVTVIEGKDYIFPTAWSAASWLVNLSYIPIVAAGFVLRARRDQLVPGEKGLVAGCLALVVLFFLSLPFVAGRVALAVQLQMSRVFWMAELVALAYVLWAMVEWSPPAGRRPRMAIAVVVTLLVGSAARGLYVMRVGHPGRPLAQRTLAPGPWHELLTTLADRTPLDAHLLLDPGHAWQEGTSARVAARRDVFLEEVKDTALGFYSREIAMRVAERTAAVGDFSQLSAGRARDLAARYDLDYVVINTRRRAPIHGLPQVLSHGDYAVYALSARATAPIR